MIDAGDRILSMALETGEPRSNGMNILGLLRVAIHTLLQFKDFDPVMRISEKSPPSPKRTGSRGQIDKSSADYRSSHQGEVEVGGDIHVLKITGAYLPLSK